MLTASLLLEGLSARAQQAHCCIASPPLTSRANSFGGETWNDGSWSRRNAFGGETYYSRTGRRVLTCRANAFGGQTCIR